MAEDRSSSGKHRLKQVAQYPSYFLLPILASIHSIQLGHDLLWRLHLPVVDLSAIVFRQLDTEHLGCAGGILTLVLLRLVHLSHLQWVSHKRVLCLLMGKLQVS